MAPVMKTEIEGRKLISVYSEAMNKGFFLNWRVTPECVACEASEGRCGYRSATKEVLCFCSDGSTRENHCGGMFVFLLLFLIFYIALYFSFLFLFKTHIYEHAYVRKLVNSD